MNHTSLSDIARHKYHTRTSPQDLDTLHSTIPYFLEAAKIKIDLLKKYARGGSVLEVGCGSGGYLFAVAESISKGAGLDFRDSVISAARQKCVQANIGNLEWHAGDARQLPFADNTFDLCYSFACLYTIPEQQRVVGEMIRCLKSKGRLVVELGNYWSLNRLVSLANSETPDPYYLSIREMKAMLAEHGMKIVEWRRFQILPYWGSKPRFLRVFLSLRWRTMFEKKVKGKMIDEFVSSFPVLRAFAFRHVIVCEKP